jgi:Cell division protein CrgA
MPKDSVKGPQGRVTPKSTGRYTPPVPKEVKVSPRWVPALMGILLLLGAAVILLNYVNILPGSVTNWYLLAGLGLITAGFITATQWR